MEPDKLMDSLSNQLSEALKSLDRAKTVEEKVAYSQIAKNLSESLGVFFNFVTDSMGGDYDFDDEE